ncbi:hypothetical protein HDV00_011790 [Rhizophlyctis rosea]|nr:hypothetical protein HDV00_011790 [Rhizophlyctis rosea]
MLRQAQPQALAARQRLIPSAFATVRWYSPAETTQASPVGTASTGAPIGSIDVPNERLPKRNTLKKKKVLRDVPENGLAGLAPVHELMKATAYCTAEKYDFNALLPILRKHYVLLPFIADDVYQVHLTDPATLKSPSWEINADSQERQPEAYIFPTGSFVTWGATISQSERLLRLLKKVEVNPSQITTEEFLYCEDPEHAGGLVGDTIIVGHGLSSNQAKLAYSAGLARSAKLESLEEHLDAHLEKHRHIPQILLQGKKPPLGPAVLRQLGELFVLRGNLNLHSEMLDLPEFCWSSSRMEEAFERISRNLDVRARIGIFNKKLDYANELAEVLRNNAHEEHSIRLEWIIIILITVEVAFEIAHWMDKVGMIDVEGFYRRISGKPQRQVALVAAAPVQEFMRDEPLPLVRDAIELQTEEHRSGHVEPRNGKVWKESA